MPEAKAKMKARVYQSLVKHPQLSYRAIERRKNEWGVGQFFEESLVGIIA